MFGELDQVDIRLWTTLIGGLVALVVALVVGIIIYPKQKQLDRRLDIYKGLIDSSVKILAPANQLRKIVDASCMDVERLKKLPQTDEYKAVISDLERNIIELQLLAPQPVFEVVSELMGALGRYRHVPIQRLQRWERESASFSNVSSGDVEEDIGAVCTELQLKFAHQIQLSLHPLIGIRNVRALKKH